MTDHIESHSEKHIIPVEHPQGQNAVNWALMIQAEMWNFTFGAKKTNR